MGEFIITSQLSKVFVTQEKASVTVDLVQTDLSVALGQMKVPDLGFFSDLPSSPHAQQLI